MTDLEKGTYPPLNTLKEVAPDLWVVDGGIIRFGPRGLRMPFPTRMTVIRLSEEALFIHSPTALCPELADELRRMGRPRWIVGPNRLHYWWIPQWHIAYPDAQVYVAPRIAEQGRGHIDFATLPLDRRGGYPWDEQIETLPVVGSYMTEIVFFHRASRTVILTDLIENFERTKLGSPMMRVLTRLGGVRDPDGKMPIDMRFSFRKYRQGLASAVNQMLEWNPERVILAHGRWYNCRGADEIRRAFRGVLT